LEEHLNKSGNEIEEKIREMEREAEEEGRQLTTEGEERAETDATSSDEEGNLFYTPGLEGRVKTSKASDKRLDEFSGATFADLVNTITAKTSDFSNGKIRFNVKDSTTVSRVMGEILLRYGRMERKVLGLQKDCEKEREKQELMRDLYDKELEKRDRALEKRETEIEKYREGGLGGEVLERLGELIEKYQGVSGKDGQEKGVVERKKKRGREMTGRRQRGHKEAGG